MRRVKNLSVFFPAYNEAANIGQVVQSALEVLPRVVETFEVIVVDDGSTDDTEKIVQQLCQGDPRVRLISHHPNRGYGAALRSGFYSAQYDLIAFTDGDGQFDLSEITSLLEKLEKADLVIGYRRRRAEGSLRVINAKLWALLMRILFGLRVKDIDCAFKLMRREVLEKIPKLESDGALISAELLIKAQRFGFRIVEVPVSHLPRRAGSPTGANLKVILKAFWELAKFWRKMR